MQWLRNLFFLACTFISSRISSCIQISSFHECPLSIYRRIVKEFWIRKFWCSNHVNTTRTLQHNHRLNQHSWKDASVHACETGLRMHSLRNNCFGCCWGLLWGSITAVSKATQPLSRLSREERGHKSWQMLRRKNLNQCYTVGSCIDTIREKCFNEFYLSFYAHLSTKISAVSTPLVAQRFVESRLARRLVQEKGCDLCKNRGHLVTPSTFMGL